MQTLVTGFVENVRQSLFANPAFDLNFECLYCESCGCQQLFIEMESNMYSTVHSDSESEDELEQVHQWIADNEEMFKDMCGVNTKRRRNRTPKVDLWKSVWGLMLRHPDVEDGSTKVGQKFRRRFRVPYPVFREVLVPLCIEKKIFNKQRSSYIPVDFKVLLALRILGRGVCADDIEELTGIGESTVLDIFHQFCAGFTEHCFHLYVKTPEGEKLSKVMEVYRRLGLPGAMGSIDATHVKWDKCPVYLTHACKGKEGYPSLAFMVVVDHSRTITHCSRYFYGACNDKQIIANDDFCIALARGGAKDVEYELYGADGTLYKCAGAYLISDGGMLKVSSTTLYLVVVFTLSHSMILRCRPPCLWTQCTAACLWKLCAGASGQSR
jgi:hypothetical protein